MTLNGIMWMDDLWNEQMEKSFKNIFDYAMEEKLSLTKNPEKRLSTQNTIVRLKQSYNRYIFGTELENLIVTEISPKDIEKNYRLNLCRYELRLRAVANLRTVYKYVFDTSMMEGWINVNPFYQTNFKRYKDLIVPNSDISERGYTEDEIARMRHYISEKLKENPYDFSMQALKLQMMCGFRRGELPPLRWEDITEDYIYIHREQLLMKDGGEEIIVGHTKTWKDRYFPITKEIREFLDDLRKVSTGEYLFPYKDGCITNQSIYTRHYNMCLALRIPIVRDVVRGTHAYRRNAITEVINKSNGNVYLAAKLFGNSYDVIDAHYYLGVDLKDAKAILEK